jgi:hypothetical protein
VYLIASLSQMLESFADWGRWEKGEEFDTFEGAEDECEKEGKNFFVMLYNFN